MVNKADIFYIPGLGDTKALSGQRTYVSRLNRLFKKRIYFFEPKWQTPEPAHEKLARLRHEYEAAGKPTKIYGISAGASLSILLAHEYDVTLRTIAGKMKGSSSIGPAYQKRAPAFLEIVQKCEKILEQDTSIPPRLTTYSPFLHDGIVPMTDMIVEGASHKTLPLAWHTPAIIASLAIILPFY